MRSKKLIKTRLTHFKALGIGMLILLLISLCLEDRASFAATISAIASGSLSPTTANYPATVTNGDFLIGSNSADPQEILVGDGVNEHTIWTFDFTADPNFSTFPTSGQLQSALLTLTLTPKNYAIDTDRVKIDGLPDIITPVIQTLPVDVTSIIQLELLDFYSSAEILGIFTTGSNGEIPMYYYDDAIVSCAQLDLASVPIPSTIFLLGSSLLGIFGYGSRQKKVSVSN